MCHINAYDSDRGKTYAQLSLTTSTSADHETGVSFPFWEKKPTTTKPHPFEGVARKIMQTDVNRFSKQDGSFYSTAVFDFFPFVFLNVDQRLLSTARHLSRGLLTVSLGWPHF